MTNEELVKRCVMAVSPHLAKNHDGTPSLAQLWLSWIALSRSPDPVATAEAIVTSSNLREGFGSALGVVKTNPPDPPTWLVEMAGYDLTLYEGR